MTTFEKVILGAAAFTEEMCLLVGGDRDGHAVIIRAYFDESGVHVGAPVTAVAAYFAEAKSWKAFTRRWLNTLRQFGVAEFHMNDYAQRHCAFDGWTSEKQRALGERLFPLIPAHTKFGISVAMLHADFDEVLRDYPNIKKGLGTPYACCFQWLISLVIDRIKMPGDWRLGCIHEDNDYKHEAIEAWDWVKKSDSANRLGTFAFAPAAECVPLQAADVLAWETQKLLAEPDRPERKSLISLRQNITIQSMNRDWLKANAPRLDALAAEALKANDRERDLQP